MFGSLKSLIAGRAADARQAAQFETGKSRLATAALLVRVATADGDMSEAKRAKLHAVLKSGLGLDDPTTERLIVDATAADRGAVDLYHFTRQLNDVLDDEGRRRVIRTMWEVILVDGTANEFASNLVWRTADLLGVSSRQRIALRQLIAAAIPAEVAVPKTW